MPEKPTKKPVNRPADKPAEVKTEKFKWLGPVQGIELKIEGQSVFQGTLVTGRDFDLPTDHQLVINWKSSALLGKPDPLSTKEKDA